eukprot:TRINITY_DN2792_c0_g1_i3.p1 TRINITY_DN2792_c0_g1~~TRINITY_DN2792_c0_g1_i3.p1  ORF type:complete len:699 (-),score=140.89 TRINITY_DN2792_c0_g1_i3:781-2877(-)
MDVRPRKNADRKPLAKSLSMEVSKKHEPTKKRRKSLETGMEGLVQAYYEDKFMTTKHNTDRELSAFLVDLHQSEHKMDKELYTILKSSAEKILSLSAAELRKHSMKDTVIRIFKVSKQTEKENQTFVARLLNILAKCSRLVEYLNVENANFKDATFVEYNAISMQRTPSSTMSSSSAAHTSQGLSSPSSYSSEEEEDEDFGMSGFIKESTRGFSQPALRTYDQMDTEPAEVAMPPGHQLDENTEAYNDEPSYILCRICERPVLEDVADEHTQQCVQVATHKAKASSLNVLLRKLMNSAENEFNRHPGASEESKSLFREMKFNLQKVIRLSSDTESTHDAQSALGELRAVLEELERRNLLSNHITQDISTFASQKTRILTDILQYYCRTNRNVGEHVPSITDYEVKKVISRGNFGQVYLATKKKTGDQYAIKVLKKQEMLLKNQAHHVKTERDILAFVNNPFVVKLYFAFTSKKYLYLVMEYLPGGDFYSMLEEIGAFEESVAQHYVAELVLALEYLHAHGIIHRDLKPDNMLIGNDGHMKLTDFGLSRIGMADVQTEVGAFKEYLSRGRDMSELTPQERRFSQVGTAGYLAPEIFMGLDHGPAVDWWAVGIILYEFLLGTLPFMGDTFDEICSATFKHDIIWPRDDDGEWAVTAEARDLIEKLLIMDPRERLGSKRGAIVQLSSFLLLLLLLLLLLCS